MKKLKAMYAILLSAGVVFASGASFDAQAKQFGKGGHKGKHARNLFVKLDANQDGQLVLSELTDPIPEKAEKHLAKKDTDADGLISFEEATAKRSDDALDLSEYGEQISACVAELKAEKADEYIQIPDADSFKSPQDKFSAVDTDANGFIDLAELEAAMTVKANTAFSNMDVDEDGVVTEAEYGEYAKAKKATRRAIGHCVKEIKDELAELDLT